MDKDLVFQMAKEQNKYILLFVGRTSCEICQRTSDYFTTNVYGNLDGPVDMEGPLKKIIDDNFIDWFSETPRSGVYSQDVRMYINPILEVAKTLPLVAIIDPDAPGDNVRFQWGSRSVEEWKEFLTSGLPVSNHRMSPAKNEITLSGNILRISNQTNNEWINIFMMTGQPVASIHKNDFSVNIDASHFPKGVLIIHSSEGWSTKAVHSL